jgi:hypothetical protein
LAQAGMDRALGAPGIALHDLPARQRLAPFVIDCRASEEFRPAPELRSAE